MEEIGIYEAKTRFSKLAARVQKTGKSITITNRGKPVADIVPHQPVNAQISRPEALAALAEMRRTLPKTSFEQIKADIAEERR